MSPDMFPCPAPPDWRVPWEELDARFEWLRAMRGCQQDPIHHAEGDVWIHTRMVCEELAALPAFRALPAEERSIVFASALLHDVAKPYATRVGADGRVSSHGHSERGELLTRQVLWRLGVPLAVREQVAGAVRHHHLPFFALDRDDGLRRMFEASQRVRCDHLALVTEADARGRRCENPGQLLDSIELFRAWCAEQECLERPRAFASDHARFLYFQRGGEDPGRQPHEDFRCEVVLMSGLPGAGKDTWVRTHLPGWPVVSLDALRKQHGVDWTDDQGPIVSRAREEAREYLRKGTSFVWNATNLNRQVRARCIHLFADYGARVRIVYLDVPEERLLRQNRERSARVREVVIRRFLERWMVPDRTEAHQVDWVELR